MLTAIVFHAGAHAVIIGLSPADAGKIHFWIGNNVWGIVSTASALNDENRRFVADSRWQRPANPGNHDGGMFHQRQHLSQ